MARTTGRAYAFIRWSGAQGMSDRLGEVGWAFEYNDRSGRFHCFYCGSTEPVGSLASGGKRAFWFDRCMTLPDLVNLMSGGPDHLAFDEAKVFNVDSAESDIALQVVNALSVAPDDMIGRTDPIEHTREILTRYGVRSLAHTRGFNAPFLWYNMLPGRTVPVRKLPVHVFQMRAAETADQPLTAAEVEDSVRRIAQRDPEVRNTGECFVCRNGVRFVVGLNISVEASCTVGQGRAVAQRVEHAVRTGTPQVSHIFIQVEPFEKLE